METLIAEARVLGLDVRDTMFRHEAGGIGDYPPTPVGPECRALTVVYDGPVMLEAIPDSTEPRMPSADPRIRALGEALIEACRSDGVDLWFGHRGPGIGCLVQYSPPASRRAAKLAEDIRLARVRALSSPGIGHEQRLAQLMGGAS